MITSSKKTSYQYLRKIMVLPVAAIVVALFAFNYKNKKERTPLNTPATPVTVVIDAGHGMDAAGQHTGVASSDGSYEDDIVLSIAKKVKELNTNDRLHIILTRENTNTVDLRQRVEFSNSQKADLLLSLHTNAAAQQEKENNGFDIYISQKDTKHYAENKILATILYNYFYQIRPVHNIKLSKEKIYIIDNSDCPSALLECGYLTDPNDLAFVKNESGQAQIAKSILQSIEQYFLQKGMPDWDERKRVVSDSAKPVITFDRNASTGKMEGSYNQKKFTKMTEYGGQFAFYFDDKSSTMVMISKEQTEELKKKYGKSLNELIIKDPEKQEAEQKERQELKEIEEKKLDAKKEQAELKHLLEEKQLEEEKQQLELKQMMTMKHLEMEKAQLEFKQLMTQKQRTVEEEMEFKKRMDTLQNKDREEAMQKFKLLMDDQQRDTEKMQKEFEEGMKLKQLEAEKNAEELKKIMILMKEKGITPEQLKEMLQERKEQIEKSKTNNKKVKS